MLVGLSPRWRAMRLDNHRRPGPRPITKHRSPDFVLAQGARYALRGKRLVEHPAATRAGYGHVWDGNSKTPMECARGEGADDESPPGPRDSTSMNRNVYDRRMNRAVGVSIALWAMPASAAVVGQTFSVGDITVACPSVATLNRYEKRARDDTALATKDALAEGCQEVSASNQGTINKVAGGNVCVLFLAEARSCLWMPARAASGRINLNQDPRPSEPSLGGALQGIQKLFGF